MDMTATRATVRSTFNGGQTLGSQQTPPLNRQIGGARAMPGHLPALNQKEGSGPRAGGRGRHCLFRRGAFKAARVTSRHWIKRAAQNLVRNTLLARGPLLEIVNLFSK